MNYWQTRCEAAEQALQRARTALNLTPQRRRVLEVLGALKAGENLTTHEISEKLQLPLNQTLSLLSGMDSVGLVDRTHGRVGRTGAPSRWKLAHLVQIEEAHE